LDPAIAIAMIAACAAFIGSIVGPVVNARMLSRSKLEDWERQDVVAARAAAADKKLAETQAALVKSAEMARLDLHRAQAESIRRTDEVAKVAADGSTVTQYKLDEIHTLVDGAMTATRKELLEQMEATRELILRMAQAERDAGQEPSAADKQTLGVTEQRIKNQEAIIHDREEQQERLDEKVGEDE
jgi:hypothetical protein